MISCPVCLGHILQSGVNDLATTRPDLMVLWSPRNALDPTQITRGSKKFAEWLCAKDPRHVFQCRILDKAVKNVGCAVCRGLQIIVGVNDAATLLPQLVAEWHPTLNPGENFQDYTRGYNATRHWWQCQEVASHKWPATILDRGRGSGCPVCCHNTSGLEVSIKEFIQSVAPGLCIKTNDRTMLKPLELYLWIPSLGLGIEVNGEYWHSETRDPNNHSKHNTKEAAAKSAGIRLMVLWEDFWAKDRASTETDLISVLAGGPIPPRYSYEYRRQHPYKRVWSTAAKESPMRGIPSSNTDYLVGSQ